MPVEWRQCPGVPGYEVSSDGRIRSVPRIVIFKNGHQKSVKGCERKTFLVKGYRHLALGVDGKKRNFYVHLLVCEAFHGPRPSPVHEARHLNGDPLDNSAANLTWGTKRENALDTVRHGRNPWANKTHCPQGHEYTPENTAYWAPSYGRFCKACDKEKRRKYYAANREAVLARQRRARRRAG